MVLALQTKAIASFSSTDFCVCSARLTDPWLSEYMVGALGCFFRELPYVILGLLRTLGLRFVLECMLGLLFACLICLVITA